MTKREKTTEVGPKASDFKIQNGKFAMEIRGSNFLVKNSVVLFLLAVCCCLCMKMDSISIMQAAFWKIGFSLGSRAICSFLLTIGCSGGLTLALGFAVRALFSGGTEVRCWMDNLTLYVGGGGSSSKEPSLPDLNLPPTEEDPENQRDLKRKAVEEEVWQMELSKIEEQKNLLGQLIGLVEKEANKYQSIKTIPSSRQRIEERRSIRPEIKGSRRRIERPSISKDMANPSLSKCRG